MKRILIALIGLALAGTAAAETFTAKVIAVMDGDTVMVLQGEKRTTIRLAGIDAPETRQAYGGASRDTLAALVLHKAVRVSTRAVDEYGRVVALLQIGGINVNEEQLRRGMAWEFSHYHADQSLTALQAEARHARRGLWAQAAPQPPWEYRKAHPDSRDANAAGSASGIKRRCAQMVSCEEARYYLTQCRVSTLDKDGDGVPCERLCQPQWR